MTESQIGDIMYELLTEGNKELKKSLGHSKDMVQDCKFDGYPIVGPDECSE